MRVRETFTKRSAAEQQHHDHSDFAGALGAGLLVEISSWNVVWQLPVFTCSGLSQKMSDTRPGVISMASRIVTLRYPQWLHDARTYS
jgi:hypothetical protein